MTQWLKQFRVHVSNLNTIVAKENQFNETRKAQLNAAQQKDCISQQINKLTRKRINGVIYTSCIIFARMFCLFSSNNYYDVVVRIYEKRVYAIFINVNIGAAEEFVA